MKQPIIGSFVSLKDSGKFHFNKDGSPVFSTEHVGLLFDIKEDTARVLWLSKGCNFTVHWGIDNLKKTDKLPKNIDWNRLAEKIGYWFESMQIYSKLYSEQISESMK